MSTIAAIHNDLNQGESVVLEAFRQGIKPPDPLTVSQWAEKNLVLSERSTNYPGPFKLDLTPYIREPLDFFSDPQVSHITICSAAQVAKTTFQLACLGYVIDQDPSPTLLVLPNSDLCRSLSEQRLHPLITDCEALARHKPKNPKQFRLQEMFMDRMTLALVGSNSAANLSSRPVRYLMLDEIDKYPGASKKEAGAVDLAEKRTRTFWNRKIVKTSTPTTDGGEIWRAYLKGDQRVYYVHCPHCDHFQPLLFNAKKSVLSRIYDWKDTGELKWDKDAKDDKGRWDIDKVKASVYYECGKCKAKILERHRQKMLLRGKWVAHKRNVNHKSFHLSALYPMWVNWADMVVNFLEAKDHPDSFRDFINSTLGEPWEELGDQADENKILEHKMTYSPGTVPFNPIEILITADVQRDSIWYVVRAWGEFERSALLRYGQVVGFDALAEIGKYKYRGIDKHDYMATWGYIDSGDQTDAVYDFCKDNNWIPVKGFDQNQRKSAKPYQWTKQPNGLNLLSINGAYYKDSLQTRLTISNDSVSAWWLHSETGFDYAEQLCGEAKIQSTDTSGREVYKWKVMGANELLDCEVYQLAAAAERGVRDSSNTIQPLPESVAGGTMKRRDGRDWLDRGST